MAWPEIQFSEFLITCDSAQQRCEQVIQSLENSGRGGMNKKLGFFFEHNTFMDGSYKLL